MDSQDKINLIEKYQNGDLDTKKTLEKQYGKTQIREIVEKKLTNDYLKASTTNWFSKSIFILVKITLNLKKTLSRKTQKLVPHAMLL